MIWFKLWLGDNKGKTAANAATSPDIIRPSAVTLDARAYISSYFAQNTTSAMQQLLLFYSYVPQWWLTWGNPVPLNVVLPDYFGDIFRYPYTDVASNTTMPFAYFVIEQIKVLPNVVLSITTAQNTADMLASKHIAMCEYGIQYNIPCNLRVETDDVSYAPGTFYSLGYQYFQQTLINTTNLMHKAGINSTYFLPYVVHDLVGISEMTVTDNATFANAAPQVTIWIADATIIQYYGMNGTVAVFQFTNTLYKNAHLRVSKIQIDATTMLTATPQYLHQFINYAATQGVQVELYLSNIQWGLTTYNGYYNAFNTLNAAINLVYAGNQTYPPSAPGTLPTMTPAPSSGTPTFPPTLLPTNLPTSANGTSSGTGSNPGHGNNFNATTSPTGTSAGSQSNPSLVPSSQQASLAGLVQPGTIMIAAVVVVVSLFAAASV